jgi:hypothetical protein
MPLFYYIDNRLRFTVEVLLGNELDKKSLSEIIMRVTAILNKTALYWFYIKRG